MCGYESKTLLSPTKAACILKITINEEPVPREGVHLHFLCDQYVFVLSQRIFEVLNYDNKNIFSPQKKSIYVDFPSVIRRDMFPKKNVKADRNQ